MTEPELISLINDEITFSGSLPYNIPVKEIKNILQAACVYFFDNWRDAVEPRYIIIPPAVFNAPQYLATRTITLPDCVQFVHLLQEAGGGGSMFGTVDRDFSDSKVIGSELMLTPFVGEGLVYQTVMLSFLDLAKAFTTGGKIQFDYNKNTKKLTILGKTPLRNLVLKVMKKIELEDMYNDDMFQRYTKAKAKIRLAHMLSSFEFQLPGNVKVNYGNMLATAEKEMDKVLEDMKGENTADWMLFYH